MNKEEQKVETTTEPTIVGNTVAVSCSKKDIETMAHKNFPYGSEMPIGSRDRSLYEIRKEAFIAGFNACCNYR